MQKHSQFHKSEVLNWKKEATHSSQEFQNHLKTETFFQCRRRDFQMSSSQLLSSKLTSSETNMNPTSTSCQNSNLSLLTYSDLLSVAECSPISDNPCLDLPSIPARWVLHDYVPVDEGGCIDLDPEQLSDDVTDPDNSSLVLYYLNWHFMVDKWVQSTLINYNHLSSLEASTTGQRSGHSLIWFLFFKIKCLRVLNLTLFI